jgi:hypothetical protein
MIPPIAFILLTAARTERRLLSDKRQTSLAVPLKVGKIPNCAQAHDNSVARQAPACVDIARLRGDIVGGITEPRAIGNSRKSPCYAAGVVPIPVPGHAPNRDA